MTQNRLRAAGTELPAGHHAPATSPIPKDAMGPAATQLFNDIMATVKAGPTQTPFDIAQAIVAKLQLLAVPLRDERAPASATSTRASSSASPPRSRGSASTTRPRWRSSSARPTSRSRLVEGFLPGDLDPATGKEEIRTGGAHAWVEVYFPGYGWQMFDPTGPGGLADGSAARGEGRPDRLGDAGAHVRPLEQRPRGRHQPPEPAAGRRSAPGRRAAAPTCPA